MYPSRAGRIKLLSARGACRPLRCNTRCGDGSGGHDPELGPPFVRVKEIPIAVPWSPPLRSPAPGAEDSTASHPPAHPHGEVTSAHAVAAHHLPRPGLLLRREHGDGVALIGGE